MHDFYWWWRGEQRRIREYCLIRCNKSTVNFLDGSFRKDMETELSALRLLPGFHIHHQSVKSSAYSTKPRVSARKCALHRSVRAGCLHTQQPPALHPPNRCISILTSKITEMPLRGSGAKNCSWATATSSLLEAYSRLEMFLLSLILVTIQRTSPSIPPGWAPLFPDCAAVADSLSWPATGFGCSRLSWARSLACSLFSSFWTPSLQ